MNCIHITACLPPGTRSAYLTQAFWNDKADVCTPTFLGTKRTKNLNLTFATSRCQPSGTVCLFGGKRKSENGNEESPWNALEKAVGNFKKEQSIEDVLRQQIQKQEFSDDGGSGAKPPSGGGGGGDGSSEDENEGSEMRDEFVQVFLATAGFIFLYIYIIDGEEINVLTKDVLRFLFTRQKSIRLRRMMDDWKSFLDRMKEEEEYDPYWLEREILNTPTWFDGPAKYEYIYRALLEKVADQDSSFSDNLDRSPSDIKDYGASDNLDYGPSEDQDYRRSDNLDYKPPDDDDDDE